MSGKPLFETEDLGDIVVVSPIRNMGEFEMTDVNVPVYQQLIELTNGRGVVINLSQTDYFGSSTIGMFIQLVKHVHEQNLAIALCNLSQHQQQVVGITHVSEILDVMDSRAEAIEFVRNSTSKAVTES
jgi:anti-anti-sigma factor